MKNSGRYSEGVRIVHIETQYVETDVLNFRTVVQRLTGKNAEVKAENDYIADANVHVHGGVVTVKPDEGISINSNEHHDDNVLSSMKVMNLSFKDFERLLSEFPLMEELPWLS